MANDQIRIVQDVPTLYFSEATEFYRLNFLNGRTTTGSYSFTSSSSGTNYTGTGGEQGLYNELSVALTDYKISAIDINSIRSWIYGQGMPLLNGVKTQLIRTNGALTEVQLLQSDNTTLISKVVLNRTNGILMSVTNYIYLNNGTSVVAQWTDTLNRVDGQLDNIPRTITV